MRHLIPVYAGLSDLKDYNGSWTDCGNLIGVPIGSLIGVSSRTK